MDIKTSRENAAANAVAARLTVVLDIALTVRKWDDGTKDAMHDFYIEGDGHKVALEVTTIADGRRVGRVIRWEQEAPGGWTRVEGLSGCWTVYHEGDVEASDVVGALQAHLPQLEALGLLNVDPRSWQQHMFALESPRPVEYKYLRALNLVGISSASCVVEASAALPNEHGGEVQVVRGWGASRPSDRNVPVEFINEQLRPEEFINGQLRAPGPRRSDVKKLLAVDDATARHLWMWVEPAEGFSMIRSFEVEGMPDLDLEVEGIEGVWLGMSPAKSVVAGSVWLRGFGWSDFSAARNEVVAV